MASYEEKSRETIEKGRQAIFQAAQSRRSLLKGAAAGAAGLAMANFSSVAAHAQSLRHTNKTKSADMDAIVAILTVARTAEQLAVTFYSNGVAKADTLGIKGDNLEYLKAALIEEQIHQKFFAANGGESLTETFSFPKGAKTFEDLHTFIETQQQLEGVFDSAFLAAIKEFCDLGHSDLAQISGQVACIEAEHRALGRSIAGLVPADNWAFTPVLIAAVADAPAIVTDAGYLSPTDGNSYKYMEVSTVDSNILYRAPFAATEDNTGRG